MSEKKNHILLLNFLNFKQIFLYSMFNYTYLTSSNKLIKDISRIELESLILKINEEFDLRSNKIKSLNFKIPILIKTIENYQEQARKGTINLINSPEIQISPFKSNISSTKKINYNSQITGSFNPYLAGNKKIVTLRHKISEIFSNIQQIDQQIMKYNDEINNIKFNYI